MARARGANAVAAMAFETSYGAVPNSGFALMPFATESLGDEQGLLESDLLGSGRHPGEPSRDVINNEGSAVVPLDLRNFGYWLKLLMGDPTTVAGLQAAGSITFSAQPANNATITLDGVTFTFVSGTPASAVQIKIGATLAKTIANAVKVLNASADTDVAAATYASDPDQTAILITHDAPGTAGNSFTLAASNSPDSHGTVSASTLAGGAASGAYHHTFVAGAQTLPSASIEIGNPDVPSFAMNYGVVADTLEIALQRSGHLNATLGLIAQGELPRTGSTEAGSPSEAEVTRFSQFSGQVYGDGAPLGDVVSGKFTFSNGLDKVEVIRRDGRIAGADPGMMRATGDVTLRFKDTDLMDRATNGEPIEIEFSWQISAAKKLRIIVHRCHLPKPKVPIEGPAGIQAKFDYQAAEDRTLGRTVTAILTNDVASY